MIVEAFRCDRDVLPKEWVHLAAGDPLDNATQCGLKQPKSKRRFFSQNFKLRVSVV